MLAGKIVEINGRQIVVSNALASSKYVWLVDILKCSLITGVPSETEVLNLYYDLGGYSLSVDRIFELGDPRLVYSDRHRFVLVSNFISKKDHRMCIIKTHLKDFVLSDRMPLERLILELDEPARSRSKDFVWFLQMILYLFGSRFIKK